MNPGPDLSFLTLTFQPWTVDAGWQEVDGICITCLSVRDLEVSLGKRLWTSGRGLGVSLDTLWGAWGRLGTSGGGLGDSLDRGTSCVTTSSMCTLGNVVLATDGF